MKQYEFDSIGTHWWLEILDDSASFTPELIATLAATAEQFDQRYSRFRDDSLVSELFRTGRLSHPPAEMIRMLNFAREMHEVSHGAFDITVGNDLHRMGYGQRSVARDIDTTKFWEEVAITPVEIILPSKIMLDFGGFGKGWLIDMFVRELKLADVHAFIVNGGGDLYVQSDKPIRLGLEDPLDATRSIGNISIRQGGLAGSNSVKRTWDDGEIRRHHIIDPATHDSSASPVLASFVAAESALIADTMATILIIQPELERELSERYGLNVMLVRRTD